MYFSLHHMNPLETYQSDAIERPMIRRRLMWALVISVLFHLGIVLWFRETHLAQFGAPTDRLVPRLFNVRTITINEDALNSADKPSASKTPDQKPAANPLVIPEDKPVAELSDGKMTPGAPPTADLVKSVTVDKPIVDTSDVQTIARVQDSAAKAMEQDLNSLNNALLKNQPPNLPHALIHLPVGNSATGQDDSASMNAASARLDRLIGHGLHAGDAPVSLPGGALFEFDSSDLRPEAIEQLRKLGTLIKLNPNVTFSIEGYTDSFGDADYNVQLSQQRADAVRSWLVQNIDVDPSHIQAFGYGATNFLVMPGQVDMHSQASIDREKQLEQPNRRVEIRFKFPRNQ